MPLRIRWGASHSVTLATAAISLVLLGWVVSVHAQDDGVNEKPLVDDAAVPVKKAESLKVENAFAALVKRTCSCSS